MVWMVAMAMAMAMALALAAVPAHARKACEELRSEIEAKIRANGGKRFTLDIVPNEKAKRETAGNIVGSCDGGTRKIVYKRR